MDDDTVKPPPEKETIVVKEIMYKGYKFMYKIRSGEIMPDLHYITVVGGPKRIRASTSCGKSEVKEELMKLIKSIGPMKLGKRTAQQEAKVARSKYRR